jgi:hypothetical protein
MVQESCYQACQLAGIYETVAADQARMVDGVVEVEQIIKDVVNQQTGRYNSFITQFAAGFQQTALEMYKWILYPILTANIDHLEQGLGYREIRTILQDKHPMGKDLNAGNVTQALQSITSLQNQKDIKPIVLDYDQTNIKMNVVDLGFLIWLNNQDRKELLDLAGLPTI